MSMYMFYFHYKYITFMLQFCYSVAPERAKKKFYFIYLPKGKKYAILCA